MTWNPNQQKMRNILIATIILSLMSCSSQKQLQTTDIPFEIGQSSFEKWLGGREKTGTGVELKIIISEAMNDMTVEKIYFRGHALDCELTTKDGISTITASFKQNTTTDTAIDKEGEKMQETFELQASEAILAYQKADEELKYVKVEGIKEKAPVLFQSRPKPID